MSLHFSKNLNIDRANFLGFSNGGTTTLQVAIKHPNLVDKMILLSALAKRNNVLEWFWGFMAQAKLKNMHELIKIGNLKVASNKNDLKLMLDRDAKRIVHFKDIPDDQLKSIKAPDLIIIADQDISNPEHAIEMHKQIANSS